MTRSKDVITDLEVRGEKYDVTLEILAYGTKPSNRFVAQLDDEGGTTVKADTLTALYDKLMVETKVQAITLDIRIASRRGTTPRLGRIVKWNKQSRRASVQWDDGTRDNSEIGFRERYFNPTVTEEQLAGLDELQKRARDALRAYEDEYEQLTFNARETVDAAYAWALGEAKSEVAS